jgi:AcrR family transcriptional regulator
MNRSAPAYRMRARADAVEATRGRLIQSALAAFSARLYDDVTIASVARDAGVSHQTLLNHFGSKEGLYSAAVEVAAERIGDTRAGAIPGNAASIVGALIDQYEQHGDANARAAALDERIPAVAAMLVRARAYHQQWLAEMFADHLPAAGARRRDALAALHAATDVYTWKLLRRDLGLSRRATSDTMTRIVTALLRTTPADTRRTR